MFRQEVVASRSAQWLGEVTVAHPLTARMLGLCAATFVVAFVMFCVFATYTKRIQAVGMIAPSAGLLTVRSGDPAIVERLDVRIGDRVQQGQVVAVLRGSGGTADGLAADELDEVDQLSLSAAEGAQSAGLASLMAEEAEIKLQQDAVAEHWSMLRADIELRREQFRIIREDLRTYERLSVDQLVSKADLNNRRITALEAEARLSAVNREAAQLSKEIRQLERRLDGVRARKRQTIFQLETQRSKIKSDRIARGSQGRSFIRAPVAGRVLSLPVNLGDSVGAQAALMTLMGERSRTGAYLELPEVAMPYARLGARVRVRVTSYPHQQFGQLSAVIRRLERSASAMPPGLEAGGSAGSKTTFRAFIEFDQMPPSMHASDSLLPGMTIQADIYGEKRSLLGWMVRPFRDLTRDVTGR